MEWQQRSIDVKARDKLTVDKILNNSVFASPCYGDIMCSFCCNMIITRDIADVLAHLVNRHKKLVRSWFSCPVCISTTITDWNGFSNHWLQYHSSCLSLIVVLEEANIAVRLSNVYGPGTAYMDIQLQAYEGVASGEHGLRDRGPPHEVRHWWICGEGSV